MVTLLSDYEVCKEGDVLTPEQARILVSSQYNDADTDYFGGLVNSLTPCVQRSPPVIILFEACVCKNVHGMAAVVLLVGKSPSTKGGTKHFQLLDEAAM